MPNPGSRTARELLAHQAFLKRLAFDLVGEDADDLVQDVWQRALERPPHHGRQLRSWLARVARNLASNRWRDQARRREREERRAREAFGDDELEARFELRRELVDALDGLGEPNRETVLLRYFEGLAPGEIAERQGTPVATVKTRLRRGLAQLREALDRRHDGDRGAWVPAVTSLALPVASGVESSTAVLGGMVMGTMLKGSVAVLVAAACVYFVGRALPNEHSAVTVAEPSAAEEKRVSRNDTELVSALEDGSAETMRQRTAAATTEPAVVARDARRLRVVLEGIDPGDASSATITARGVHAIDGWPMGTVGSWQASGLTSELDLDPVLSSLGHVHGLRQDALEIAVEHPEYLGERARVEIDEDPAAVHEVRIRMVRPSFWPEFSLSVRDAETREHLDNVELRIASGPNMAVWGRTTPGTLLGNGLNSPIAMMGGRDAKEEPATVAGVALAPATGSPRLVALSRRRSPERGTKVSARAPGYAWGSTSLDVSKGERELLLEPAAELNVRLGNVQLERYAELETEPVLCIYWIREDGGNQYVHFAQLDEALEREGLRLDSLVPGGYRVAVELGGGSWTEQPVLAIEEVSIAAGEVRSVSLALDDPPEPPVLATLGGVVSFPVPDEAWAKQNVRLQLYFQPTQRWRRPDFQFGLTDLRRVGGALPSWSFEVMDLPVGRYRVQLMPFLKVWMIDLPPEGAPNLELVLPELAEVLVETVDDQTGDRLPRGEVWYRFREPVPGQSQRDLARAVTEEPGRFRFWAAPGGVRVWAKFPDGSEREYGGNGMDLDLVPGLQSAKFELAPSFAMHFEFREDGTTLPIGPLGLETTRDIRAVGHDGHVTGGGLQRNMRVRLSAAGLYEIDFDGLDAERYHAVPARRVEVRSGEATEVIVELRTK